MGGESEVGRKALMNEGELVQMIVSLREELWVMGVEEGCVRTV